MKKIGLLALGLSIIVNSADAQFYLRAGFGDAFPQAGQTMDGAASLYDGSIMPYSGSRNYTATTVNYNIKNASFSSGLNTVLGLGYMFNDHIGVQLDGSLGLSTNKYTFNDRNTTIYYSSGTTSVPVPSNVTVTQRANNSVIFMPSLVLQTGGNPWNIYSRFGLALPLNSKINQDIIISNAPGTGTLTVDDYTFQVKSGFSLGFSAAAGVHYKVNDVFSVWGEVSLLSLSLEVKESDFKNFAENGVTYPVSSVGFPLVVKYSKNATLDSTGTTQPAYAQPYSNIGINVGISVRLSEKKRGRNSELIDDDKNFKRKRF
jgi:hypothetical protein